MRKFWQIVYFFLVIPGMVILAHILAIFSGKIRKSLFKRYSTLTSITNWLDSSQPLEGKRILFHTASLGEFEHIRPILQILKEQYKTVNIVTFFSPSGYENVGQSPGLDFHTYMPVDRSKNWQQIYDTIKPALIVVAKWDIWPGQVWTAHKMGIPIFLINASLRKESTRAHKGVKQFFKYVYRDIDCIFAISQDDAHQFTIHYPHCRVEVVGDTKYDQVILRKKRAQTQNLLPKTWVYNQWIFVAGSTHTEDEEHLFPAIQRILREEKNIRFILVSHFPDEKAVLNIRSIFEEWGVLNLSQREKLAEERILVVDAIGYLAGLYNYAHCAYVGGSFHQGVHNVIEPAIFGIPVLFGPVYKNSYEAIQFSNDNGGFVVNNTDEIYHWIKSFYYDEERRKIFGVRAEKFASRNTGATERLISRWKYLIDTSTEP
jgi:3-deoxy-D-manno-octulosonic-acid transferase